jgi:hypothetical protein
VTGSRLLGHIERGQHVPARLSEHIAVDELRPRSPIGELLTRTLQHSSRIRVAARANVSSNDFRQLSVAAQIKAYEHF